VSQYVADWLEYCHQSQKERARNPHPATLRLMKIQAELDTYPPEERQAALQRILAREKREEAERAAKQPAAAP
jgi:hypothetical protein